MRNRDAADGGHVPDRLRRFADIAEPSSQLYAELARGAAANAIPLEILAEAPYGQPAANILLAAVHFLLLSGTEHALGAYYPSVSGDPRTPDTDPVPAFIDFCSKHHCRLVDIVETKTVQTNEVRRCTALLTAFSHVSADNELPLSLLEIGPSAGLNLILDRYRYDFGQGVLAGSIESPLTLQTELRGSAAITTDLPRIAWRAGIDLHPLDVTNPHDVQWGQAQLWPEQVERLARYSTAVAIARADPPKLIAGDAIRELGRLIETVPVDTHLVVFHSFVLNQFTEAQRSDLGAVLTASGRDLDRIGIEQLSRHAVSPEIVHVRYGTEARGPVVLGSAHHHGEWLAWEQ